MVDDGGAELFFGPLHGIGIGALTCQEEGAEAFEIVFFKFNRFRIFFADGAKRGRRCKQCFHAMLGNDAPEGACIRRTDRLALIDNRRRANDERGIDDVGVTHHPTNIGCGPEHIAGPDAVNAFHRPRHRNQMPAIIADDTFGFSRRAGGVEDIERVGGGYRDAIGLMAIGLGLAHQGLPLNVTSGRELGGFLRALKNNHGFGLMLRDLDRLIDQRFIMNHATRLDAAGGGEDQFGFAIVKTGCEFPRGKATKDNRVNRTNPRTRQHGEQRLGDHRHIDDDAVAFLNTEILQHGGEGCDLIAEFAIGDFALRARDRAVVNNRRAVGMGFGMAINRIIAGVYHAIGKPAAINPH